MDVVNFVKQFPVRIFVKGEALLEAGDVSPTLLALQSGFVKVTSVDDSGAERMVWIAGRYDVVPTEQLFSRQQQLRFFYTALSDGAAYQIEKSTFLTAARGNLELMTEIAISMSSHYDDLLTRINSTEQASIRQKLIATLCYLAGRFSAERQVDLYQLGLKLTHEDVATMIGATRETVSVELQKLRHDGYVDYSRSKFVIHLDKLLPDQS